MKYSILKTLSKERTYFTVKNIGRAPNLAILNREDWDLLKKEMKWPKKITGPALVFGMKLLIGNNNFGKPIVCYTENEVYKIIFA